MEPGHVRRRFKTAPRPLAGIPGCAPERMRILKEQLALLPQNRVKEAQIEL